ncbi:MAG TPA: aminotransferase class IV, partial [Candidatus Limnocylindrales bacterium]
MTAHADGPRHVWVDGRIEPADGRHLSVFDRGFQLGDGIFETLRAHGGAVAEIDEHLARLRASADGLAIELPLDTEDRLRRGIADLLAAEDLAGADGDASVRITVSRGVVRTRGLLPAPGTRPTVTIQVAPVVPPAPELVARGLHVIASEVRRDPENPVAGLKTTSRAEYVYARLEAQRAGADDALFLTLDGHLSEAT